MPHSKNDSMRATLRITGDLLDDFKTFRKANPKLTRSAAFRLLIRAGLDAGQPQQHKLLP